MTIVAFGSVRGAPGVTTTAQLLAAGLEGAVMVEADLAGGVMAVRYGLGREPGLTTLAAAGPIEPDEWRDHAQNAGGVAVLVGPDSPDSAGSLWRRAGDRLAAILDASDAYVVADIGRLIGPTPLLGTASLLLVLVRPIAEHLVALSHRVDGLRRAVHPGTVGVVLVGDGGYGPDDVTDPLGLDVFGVLPDDQRAADLLTAGGRFARSFGRSRLARAATGLTGTIAGLLERDGAHVGTTR
jgi:hypothetical protein